MKKPTLKEALKFWFKLGFISFGGPAGQIAILHEFIVEKKKWVSESKFLHALNYCMVLPGPEAQQLATYIGWMLHGRLGGIAAGLLFLLPSMFILLVLSIVYVTFGSVPWIYAIFAALKPAVIAIVLLALINIAKKSLLSPFHYFIALASLISILVFNIPFPFIILGTILSVPILRIFFPKFLFEINSQNLGNDNNESEYFINRYTKLSNESNNFIGFFRQLTIGITLWAIPLIVCYLLKSDFEFWKKLSLFFTQAACVTFGGAYAVLPYVAQVSVEKFNWLTNLQMLDGLALGETTPGPLIMVLVFVGFMAGHNHFNGSLLMGTFGLLITTFYTFLPSFIFILTGAPIIERTQENKYIKQILALISAAVVGVILNLSIYLSRAVLFPNKISLTELDFGALFWIVISFIAMYRFKINMILWIGISATFGLLNYLLLN